MKNILFAIALLLGTTGAAIAQTAELDSTLSQLYKRNTVKQGLYKQLYYGGRIGVAFSNLGGDSDSTSSRTGLMIGGFVGMDINSQFAWQAGLTYIKQGSRVLSDSMLIGIEGISGPALNANYNYLSVPVSIRYFPSEAHGLFLLGGASASLLIKSEVTGLGGDFASNSGRIDVKNQLNSLDFGLQAGLGYEWIEHLDFSVVYQYGFGNTIANGNSSINNQGWQIAIGYKF